MVIYLYDQNSRKYKQNRHLGYKKKENIMLMETTLGAVMLPNELLLLKGIVGLGFLGWMTLMFTQVVLLDHSPQEVLNPLLKPSREKAEYKKDEFKMAA